MNTEPNDILEEQKEMFTAKNDDYRDTWIVSGMALSALHSEPVTLETDIDHIVNGNVHRLLDKILRGYSTAVINDDVNFEAAVDSFRDAATYAAMIASALEGEPTTRLQTAYDNALGETPGVREETVKITAHDEASTNGTASDTEAEQ
ncbi:hypothetical protein HUG10_21480 (plasmid) [Halorarum halophilum]|uniref:Uncharacterized protein n=1 Tax=Halorarum halophilum TaxID=2743090 RepID=A0A7D5KQD0_9EURY|nr:hypothetical protein [Halobaculum halophilum]QLG30162.1 hypothetical protein HUG10_21480 [Halobaculum halophilum]